MLILNWAQDMLTGNVSGILGKILRTIFLWLDSVIYGVIGWLYKLFTLLSEVRLFENDQMRQLQSRIYIVIGVISLFLVSYSLLNAIINPDNATKGKNNSVTGIVKNIILAVIGIAIVPTCFDYAYEFQRRVLCSNVITNLFLVEDPEEDTMIKDFGSEMSLTLFQSFYYAQQLSSDGLTYEPIVYDSSEASDWKTVASAITDDDNKTNFAEAIENIKSGKSSIFEALGNFDKAFENHQLGYFLIISTIAGAYCAYVLLGFVIDISIRAVKLSYLQIIAPLPIFTLVIPNQKKVFDSWLKKTTACFMEVFVRVIAITFAAFAVKYLPLWIFSWGGIGSGMSQLCGETVTKGLIVFARAAFIIGIFGFLKQAPKFISDLLPGFDSKGFKLGFGNAFAEAGGFRALGAAGGVATAAARNIGAGAKNVKNEWDKPLGKYGNTGKFMRTAGAVFGTAASGIAGAASGGVRSFIKGKDAKKWSDSVKFAGEGADAAVEAKFKREDYKQAHGGKPWSAAVGHTKDTIDKVKNFASTDEAAYSYLQKSSKSVSKVTDSLKSAMDAAGNVVTKNESNVDFIVSDFEFKDSSGQKHTVTGNTHTIAELRKMAEYQSEQAKKTGSSTDMALAISLQNQLDGVIKEAKSQVISGKIGTDKGLDGNQHMNAEVYNSLKSLNSALSENKSEILNKLGYNPGTQEYDIAMNAIENTLKIDVTSDDPNAFDGLGDLLNNRQTGLSKVANTSKNNIQAELNELSNKIKEKKSDKK
ncbi:MAG: hypothetical protein PUD34_05220 [bacterium]|nr:hypothetical protein [bacterium]